MAATVGQRRSTPPAIGQRRRVTVVIGGQRRSTPPTTSQRWRSTTVAGGEPPLTAAGPPLTTTGPPVNGGGWAGQRAGLGRSGSGRGWVRVGSGPGPPCGMPRVSHVCTRVSHVCPSGIHVAADVDNKHTWESNPVLVVGVLAKTKRTTALGSGLNYITPYLLFNPYLN
uniref:Uncharacterized protein n=1 Tax=Tanacetum cinerariifolium TaxID=118510 RepID=A0A6L2N842_TANCI|nr:hypothetical protein [Tanacetum cinerariifolium]